MTIDPGHIDASRLSRRQLLQAGGLALGESIVTTRPKQAPRAPIMPGRPTFLTAKSSCLGKISMRIGPFGVNP